MTDNNVSAAETARALGLDGFEDEYWNLGQVVAWIWTRSPFAVDAYSDSAKKMARRDHSHPPTFPFFADEIADRGAEENGLPRDNRPFNSLDQAWKAMIRSFQSGALAASGRRDALAVREPMTPLDWADIEIDPSEHDEMIIRHRLGHASPWHDILVKRDDVLASFPAADCEMLEKSSEAESPPLTSGGIRLARPPLEKRSRGKKRGQKGYASLDAPLLIEMSQLLSQGKAASPEEAARQVARRAHGGGTVESKAERLARRFRDAKQSPSE